MTFGELLHAVVERLDAAGIPYMVTGSFASSFHGVPRSTRDVDIVIDPTPAALDLLVDGLVDAGFYVDRGAAHEALAARSQFSAIGQDAAKVDFIVRRDRPFSVEEFRRRRPVHLLGTSAFVATAEDVIVAKLEWALETGSERQLGDVAGILAIAEPIDIPYIERWARALHVEDTWHSVHAEPPSGDA